MKYVCALILTAAFGVASSAHAQTAISSDMQQQMMRQLQTMSPQEQQVLVESMSKNAEAMQTCIKDAGGEEGLNALQTMSDAHHKQIAKLCEKNKRKAAQAYAQDASQEMLKHPRVATLRKCSRMALQNMPQLNQLVETGGFDKSKHVCD